MPKRVERRGGSFYLNSKDGKRVELRANTRNSKSFKKMGFQLRHWKDLPRFVPAIPVLIEQGNWAEEALYKERKDGIVHFYKVSGMVEIEGVSYDMWLKVAEDSRGDFYYYLENPEKTNGASETSLTGGGEAPFAQGDNSLIDDGSINLHVRQGALARGTYSTSSNAVTLTPNADFSTFAHEMGH